MTAHAYLTGNLLGIAGDSTWPGFMGGPTKPQIQRMGRRRVARIPTGFRSRGLPGPRLLLWGQGLALLVGLLTASSAARFARCFDCSLRMPPQSRAPVAATTTRESAGDT